MKGNAAKALLKNHPWLAKFFPMVSGNGQPLKAWLKKEVTDVKIAPPEIRPVTMRPRRELHLNWSREQLFHLIHHRHGESSHSRTRVLNDPQMSVETLMSIMREEAEGPITFDSVVMQTIIKNGPGAGTSFTIYTP